jgi:N-acetylmuramoyl-L-alanine amidase
MRIAMSSGHGLYIRGARGSPVPPELDEVDEARRVVDRTAELLRVSGIECVTFHDDISNDQSENLNRIVNWHNAQARELDVSVHFNAFDGSANGTECLYVTQETLSGVVAAALAAAGPFTNRGAKYRSDLFFLGHTEEPAILVEVCFCDHTGDSNNYHQNYEAICEALAESISGRDVPDRPELPERPEPPPIDAPTWNGADRMTERARFAGACSHFGGPNDSGVSADEGLAFFYEYEDAPHLFLDQQPPGTTGLARRLDPTAFYVACRWDYDVTPKEMLRIKYNPCIVMAKGKAFLAWPADWGPHHSTERAADLSPGLMEALGIETDDQVEIIYLTAEPAVL